jgi:hypothetical protein
VPISSFIDNFIVCAKAIYAFGAGYKLGERYELGKLEEKRGKSIDAEAWQLGYDLSTKRYDQQYPYPVKPSALYKSGAFIGPDGLTDAQRRIDPDPEHWKHGPDVDDDPPKRE